MSKGGRSYSDPSYGSIKETVLPVTASLAGTAVATEMCRITIMEPITVTDWNLAVATGGTAADVPVLLLKSVAGTGTASAIGTITLGTNANSSVVDGTLTETSFNAGDDIVLQKAAATSADPFVVRARVKYRETFPSRR